MMADVGQVRVEAGVGTLEINSPPVNALGIDVRRAMLEGLRALEARPEVEAIVLICGGRTFFAGADITEFGKPTLQPDLHVVCDAIENSNKPVIAAMHGTALGGGLEVALVCHYRMAVPSAKMGLPEVHLGLLPGAGGTQRLPRITGVEVALDLLTSGRPITAAKALDLGVLDALAHEGRLAEDAIAFARSVIGKPLQRVHDRQEKVADARGRPEIFSEFLSRNARAFRGFRAPATIVKAIEAAAELPFDEGMKREWELFLDLAQSRESEAQRYYFFAERETGKVPDVPAGTGTSPIRQIGVIGAGTMGGGIAMNFLDIGLPVTLVETSQSAIDRGLATIRRHYESSAKKGRLTTAQVEERMSLVTPSLNLGALGSADLVIEAVFEEMAIKREVFAKLDGIAKADAVLASNTSFLDLDEIASVTARPEQVIGLHFFSPANVMRLLEVVRGARTSKEVVATAMSLARKIGKVPVLSGVCDGFIANRIMAARGRQADALILEGTSPAAIDKAIHDFGFAMGPFAMMDLVGLDVIGRGSSERTVAGELVALGRLGQKSGGGYYDYDEQRRPTPSDIAAHVIADVAASRNVERSAPLSAEAIVARVLYPVVNEGARLLEEGIALRASDIDVAAILGYNWPVYTGGPMFWADSVGLGRIVETLEALAAAQSDPSLAPAPLLVEKARTGGRLSHG